MSVKQAGFHYTKRMPPAPALALTPLMSRRQLAWAVAALLLVVLAHLLVIGWVRQELRRVLPKTAAETTISIRLQALADDPIEPPAQPAPLPMPEIPSDEPIAAIPTTELPDIARPTDTIETVDPAESTAMVESTAEMAMPSDTVAAADALPAEALTEPESADDTAQTAPDFSDARLSDPGANDEASDAATRRPALPALFTRTSPPPPAVLSFRVSGVRNGRAVEGRGTMAWQADRQRYQLTTEIGVLFFTLLKSRSEGDLGPLGLAPERYAEKRIGRSETNTHFHRERRQISFSASTAVFPTEGGEQDLGSWIWQLASLGRGDPEKFEPGLVFEILIAGTKTANRWRVYVNGREALDLPDGLVSAWRLSVIPGPESFERQFDLWLDPARDWYPVRLWHEDRNGNRIDMQLKNIAREQAASRSED